MKKYLLGMFALLFAVFATLNLVTAEEQKHHKMVIQVNSNDAKTQTIALNNAVNLQKHYGMDNVTVEVVAYGPGLSMLMAKSDNSDRVKSLVSQDIAFSACGNTVNNIEKKKGKKPKLTEGVEIVPAGVVRILELQEEGYAYLRP